MNFLEKQQLKSFFASVFEKAAKERSSHRKLITTSENKNEIEWVIFERMTMYNAVNQERIIRGKNQISLELFKKFAENRAYGHSDYYNKLSLYCAELVLEN